MTVKDNLYTMAEFVAYVNQPENANRLFELINGEIIEVSPSRTRVSEYSTIMIQAVRNHCDEHDIPCHTSGEAGAYNIDGNTIVPDFAYKPTPMSDDYPDPVPPTWAVETVSMTDTALGSRNKRAIYIKAGITLIEMYPHSKSLDVYEPGKPMRTLGLDDVLADLDVLPGFRLPIKKLFG